MGNGPKTTSEDIKGSLNRGRVARPPEEGPLDPLQGPVRTPEEVAEFGAATIRRLADTVRKKVYPGLALHGGALHANGPTPYEVGKAMLDVVRAYFDAGDDTSDKQTRQTKDLRFSLELARLAGKNEGTDEDKQLMFYQGFLQTIAYGDGNMLNQVLMCAAIADCVEHPYAVVSTNDDVFKHPVLVLTETRQDAMEVMGGRFKSFSELRRHHVVVESWTNTCCPGNQYKDQVIKNLDDSSRRNELVLIHEERTAWHPTSEAFLSKFLEGELIPKHVPPFEWNPAISSRWRDAHRVGTVVSPTNTLPGEASSLQPDQVGRADTRQPRGTRDTAAERVSATADAVTIRLGAKRARLSRP